MVCPPWPSTLPMAYFENGPSFCIPTIKALAKFSLTKFSVFSYFFFSADKTPAGFPIITQSPQTRVVEIGHTAVMQCRSTGNPTPKIFWLKDSVRLDMSNSRYSLIDGKFYTFSFLILQIQTTSNMVLRMLSFFGNFWIHHPWCTQYFPPLRPRSINSSDLFTFSLRCSMAHVLRSCKTHVFFTCALPVTLHRHLIHSGFWCTQRRQQ